MGYSSLFLLSLTVSGSTFLVLFKVSGSAVHLRSVHQILDLDRLRISQPVAELVIVWGVSIHRGLCLGLWYYLHDSIYLTTMIFE